MVYVSEKQKRINSSCPCDDICRPSTPTEKATQAGKSLVVSRSNPKFCLFCSTRHASISCPQLNPVASNSFSTSSSSPFLPAPSKCPHCVVLYRKRVTTVLDGVQQVSTLKQIELCSVHLQPDTTPPMPDLDISITDHLLQQLETDDDPLNVGSSAPLDPTPPEPVDHIILPPPSTDEPPAPSASGPVRDRKRKPTRENLEVQIHPIYANVLDKVKSGSSTVQACKAAGIARSTFYKWRYTAELKIIDPDHYRNLRDQFQEKLPVECKSSMVDGPYEAKIKEMRQKGDLLRN